MVFFIILMVTFMKVIGLMVNHTVKVLLILLMVKNMMDIG